MTPAELKTMREALGLPVAWLADRAGVQERTVRYWESGHTPVPDDVEEIVFSVERLSCQIIAQWTKTLEELTSESGKFPDEVVLLRYRTDQDLWKFQPGLKPVPATCHATILASIRRILWEMHVPCVIEYMDPEVYALWLKGRKDSEALRAEWEASVAD